MDLAAVRRILGDLIEMEARRGGGGEGDGAGDGEAGKDLRSGGGGGRGRRRDCTSGARVERTHLFYLLKFQASIKTLFMMDGPEQFIGLSSHFHYWRGSTSETFCI